ncbi:hypothetical protein [Burkholderia sp. LMG 13014]|uniref:hypothetical protein n=1 Tax=Burkholderia sp. LMG 13014 TaxID=2709306 RepID=UPI001965A9BC|nr:hypothetical protein [Burkholderia sp. LMG 13014]
MAAKLVLVSFALPSSFPPDLMPAAGAEFVAACLPGLTKQELLARAKRLGWRPSWKPLASREDDGLQAYGFGLTIGGMGVPLIARMRARTVGRPRKPQEQDPRQLRLF